MVTPTDKIVLRICALCVQAAKKEDYLTLLQHVPEDEIAALMPILNLKTGTLTEICEAVYAKDWKPLLQERSHLIDNSLLFKELNLL